MQILVTIGSGVSEGAGVEFPTFPLTCVVVLKTLWHYRASVWYVSHVHIVGDTVEINIEAAGSDITEYTPTNDKPSAGMFGFYIATFFYKCAKLLPFIRVLSFIF